MQKMQQIFDYLDTLYPNPVCALNFETPYQLLVAVVLSAQCTDKRVNQVCEHLFKIASTPEKMLDLGVEKLKQIIYPCGFYNNKSKAIISLTTDLIERFNGVVPNDMQALVSLKGVGRKTANVVMGVAFNQQTIAVDTHVHRISKRLGLTSKNSTPLQCEMDLCKLTPIENRTKLHHQLIWFGREHCKAINPDCENCKLKNICKKENYEHR